jgi:hypothetical protein
MPEATTTLWGECKKYPFPSVSLPGCSITEAGPSIFAIIPLFFEVQSHCIINRNRSAGLVFAGKITVCHWKSIGIAYFHYRVRKELNTVPEFL